MLDAHIHLHDPAFSDDLRALLERAREAGIEGWLSCSVDLPSWERTLFLSRKYPRVRPAFGIHPWYAEQLLPPVEILQRIAAECSAVGEIGLDSRCPVPMALQLDRFREQLRFAEEVGKPVVLHARCSWNLLLGELEPFSGRGLIHNFTGSVETAELLIRRGFFLSFGTALLRHPGKRNLRAAATLPLEYILIETDAPAMPFEEQGNVPANLVRVAEVLARIRNIPVETVQQSTAGNLRNLLGE